MRFPGLSSPRTGIWVVVFWGVVVVVDVVVQLAFPCVVVDVVDADDLFVIVFVVGGGGRGLARLFLCGVGLIMWLFLP